MLSSPFMPSYGYLGRILTVKKVKKNCGWDENFITAQNGFSRIMCNFAFIIIIIT